MKIRITAIAAVIVAGCAPPSRPAPLRVVGADTIAVPLTDMGARTYKGLEGGLFPAHSNTEPVDHDAIGIAHRDGIRPLDVNGRPTESGRYVLMSVGAAGVSAGWCSVSSAPPCDSWSFAGRAVSDPLVNHIGLVIVNGALPGATTTMWMSPASANYDRIRDTRLAPLGLSEKQVQVIWMDVAGNDTAFRVTASAADGALRLRRLGATIRALKQRYPNLQLLFLSSRRYGGFSAGGEPQAYESGFVVRWIVESQVNESRGQAPNSDAGELSPSTGIAPWISWGPYLWTRGELPRMDGMTWTRADYDSTGVRFSRQGAEKLGGVLIEFFKGSALTRCWFLAGPACG